MPDIQLERENRCGETTAVLFQINCVNTGILGQQTQSCKNERGKIQVKDFNPRSQIADLKTLLKAYYSGSGFEI